MDVNHLVRAATPRPLRNWLRHPTKSLRYICDYASFAFGVNPQVHVFDDWSLRCHPASSHHFTVFKTDPVQVCELEDFSRYSFAGMQLLDVGAHHGFFSLAALHFGGASARVLALEPSSRAVRIIRSNLRLNNHLDQVVVIEAALGNEDGWIEMLTTGPAGGDYLIVPTEKRIDTRRVRQRSMVNLLNETRFVPSHIKIDVEGFEEEVLLGGDDFLRSEHPVLFLELHGDLIRRRGGDPEAVIRLLQSLGYRRMMSGGSEQSRSNIRSIRHNCRLTCLSN